MKTLYINKLRSTFFCLSLFSVIFISCEDFLEEDNPVGLNSSKLTDLAAMTALNYGAFDDLRNFYAYQPMITSGFVRDWIVRRDGNWFPYFEWTNTGVPEMFSGNTYNEGYQVLNKVHTVLESDIEGMYGSELDKNGIKGDSHFLRAAVYFQMNNFYTLPSTGNSVPLTLKTIGPNDKIGVSTSAEIKAQIESDIEQARTLLSSSSNSIISHTAATAMAARIYFFHEKYDLAYERANEVILTGEYSLEENVADIYTNGGSSKEAIYTIVNNLTENGFGAKTEGFSLFQADKTNGTLSLNPNGLIGQLMNADPNDERFSTLFTDNSTVDGDGLIYVDGKYPSTGVDNIILRLPEIYLTRAESNIMSNNSVSSQDVEDVNTIKNRSGASDTVTGIPNASDMLEIIFDERSKELCFEWGDRFLNTRRLQKSIINEEGNGFIGFSNYNNLLVYPFNANEIRIHNLQR